MRVAVIENYESITAHLGYINTMIDGPNCLEVILHSLFQLFGNIVNFSEMFQVPRLGLILRPPGVDPLDNVYNQPLDFERNER